MSGPINEVHVWPKESSGSCIEIPKPPLPSQNTHILFLTRAARTQRHKASGNFANLPTYPHTINSKIKPNPSLLYAAFPVSALEPSAAGENLGHLLFPVNGYPQTRFIFFHSFPFPIFFIRLIWNWNSRYRSFSKKSLMAAPPILSLALPSETGRVLSIQSHTVQVLDLPLVDFRES